MVSSLKVSAKQVLSAAVAAALLMASGVTFAKPDTTRVIVSMKPGQAAGGRAAIRAAGGTIKLEIYGTDAVAIEVPLVALRGLENNPNIEYIEEDLIRHAFATTSPSASPYITGQLVPYGIKLVQADQMPSGDANTANRKVCIIDSGYDLAHEDLNGNSVAGEYDSGTGWWYTDENHHGTHVAGSIAAINNSGVGVVGVNPNRNLRLHIVKVFGAAGWAYSSTLTAAANKCGSAGSNIISMSLGGGRSSRTEMRTFDSLASKGVLSIAAAGNDGTTAVSYPAGYSSVLSVGALDENKSWATFSQYNTKVELSAPGVAVLSTVPMGSGSSSVLSVGGVTYTPGDMDGSPKATATGALADFGLGTAVNAAMAGKVCLIQRGTVDFATKVTNCKNSGGIGAIVYNNVAGSFGGTVGTTTTIPSVTATDTDGAVMKSGQLGASATVGVKPSSYAFFDGTSMATPHVSAVAALVWSYFPNCTAAQLRSSLTKSAEDLGTVGRDNKFGFGLVRAKAAYDRITSMGCGN